jgi:hypothetical protein
LEKFIDERCLKEEGYREQAYKVWEAYTYWCRENRHRRTSNRQIIFCQELRQAGWVLGADRDGKIWVEDLRVRDVLDRGEREDISRLIRRK